MLIAAQALLALAGLWVLRTLVFPRVEQSSHPALVADVWGPIAVVGPLLFFAGSTGGSVAGLGWAPVAAPICIGAVAIGAVLASPRRVLPPLAAPVVLSTVGAATIILLLGAARDLTIGVGQLVFALAAVLLWLNTPSVGAHAERHGASHATVAPSRPGPGLLLALLLAAGQGTAGLLASTSAPKAAVAIMVAYGVLAAAGAARGAGLHWQLRLASWSAVLGTLLGIGLISANALVPRAIAMVGGADGAIEDHVASGFEAYAIEATLLLLLPGARWLGEHVGALPRGLAGAALVAAASGLAVWRVGTL